MSAELRLVLRGGPQPDLEGWWVAAGCSCLEHEIGILVVVTPAEAAKMQAAGHAPTETAARIRCALQAFGRAIAMVTGEKTAIVDVVIAPAVRQPPNDPRTS